jgi:hypothetical protein
MMHIINLYNLIINIIHLVTNDHLQNKRMILRHMHFLKQINFTKFEYNNTEGKLQNVSTN